MIKMNNPILEQITIPLFDKIKSHHLVPAIQKIIIDNETTIKNIENIQDSEISYEFVKELSKIDYRLSNAWSQIGHLNSVCNSEEFRVEYNKCKDLITDYYSNISQNVKVFNLYVKLKESSLFAELTSIQQKVIDNEIRDFKLGGVNLALEEQAKYKKIQSKLSKLASKFEENVLDETNQYFLHIEDSERVRGIPDDVLEQATLLAKEDKKSGYYFTLHFPSYIPVLQYAHNRDLRQQLYEAYAKKASELSNPKYDNSKIIQDILFLRSQLANLLGFHNFAELSLDTKMANSPKEVCDFLKNLASKAKPFAEQDYEDLKKYALKDGIKHLEAWDVAYYSEIIKQEKYLISDQEIKQYFPEHKVIKGLFDLVNKLYGIEILESKAPSWHSSVAYYEIHQNNKIIGSFYLDLYARKNKRGGAWMDECISKSQFNGHIDYPVAYLTCNFSSPIGKNPALFTHDEVITLFHEFGHGLHHLLTQVDEYNVSGIKGVEWDAVELPSQFMENFCWNWEVIQNMTEHIKSKETMPKNMFDKLIQSKNFQSGMQTVRQVEFALFDMLIHMNDNPINLNVLETLEKVRDAVAVVRPPKWNRFPHSFSHIFAGGYAAGYYSYKWAEVLSADIFDEFLNNGVLNKDIGTRFRKEVLSVGGSRGANESFVKFKGREPTIDALLKHNGLAA
jgi:oligopeptidase A